MSESRQRGNLGTIIREARLNKKWSAERLAKEVNRSRQWAYNFESRSNFVPPLKTVLELHQRMQIDVPPAALLAGWLERVVNREIDKGDLSENDKEIILRAVSEVLGPAGETPKLEGALSLEHFPYGFEPLVIVLGDRRETRPQNAGDVLAYSLSATDVMFLNHLGIRKRSTLIRSDKLFVMMPDDWLRKEFGDKHLLIIGSPAVNFAARFINDYAVFRFDVKLAVKEQADRLHRAVRTIPGLSRRTIFSDMLLEAPNIDLEKYYDRLPGERDEVNDLARIATRLTVEFTPKGLLHNFARAGFLDPADMQNHGVHTRDINDFGVISLARNPFASGTEYVAILAAGLHGPGTAHAVRKLSDHRFFEGHPLGGVIEVELDPQLEWPRRFEDSIVRWQTRPYDLDRIKQNLRVLAEGETKLRKDPFKNITDSQLRECLSFVSAIAERKRGEASS